MQHFEDFEVGQQRVVGSMAITREDVIEFASRFDPQPFHLDDDAAKASIFGGLTASSCHTFALQSLIYHQASHSIALVANLGAENLRFPTPLRPGDKVTLSNETLALRPSESRPGIGIVSMKSLLANQDGESVMEMTSTFMVKRREGG